VYSPVLYESNIHRVRFYYAVLHYAASKHMMKEPHDHLFNWLPADGPATRQKLTSGYPL